MYDYFYVFLMCCLNYPLFSQAKRLATLIRKSAFSKVSKFQKAGPDDLNIDKNTKKLPPPAIDLNLNELREYFNEQGWTKLQNLCKS